MHTFAFVFGRLRPGAWCILLAVCLLAGNTAVRAQPRQVRVPPLAGTYRPLATHPGVFTTPAELRDLAARIRTTGSFSHRMFAALAAKVARDLAAPTDWGAVYAGCNILTYLYSFSYEPISPERRRRLQAEIRPDGGGSPPVGAAVVASRLALYAALVRAGAPVPAGGPAAGPAAALAKRILLAWSDRGFREAGGRYLSAPEQFCIDNGLINAESKSQVGLQIGRGLLYCVQAQDMLLYLGALDAAETARLNAFQTAMYMLLRNALNYSFLEHKTNQGNHYGNHVANQLAALLAIARLLDSRSLLSAALFGNDAAQPVSLPWLTYFNWAIYGDDDRPNVCYPNTGPDGLTSRPFFQTATVAPGEIDDRFRNEGPLQGIGYPMFTLERLYDAAEILQRAGFAPYRYRGSHRQSIETATAYYACYAAGAGFAGLVTAGNARACPNRDQYVGKSVNGVARLVLIGAARFPDNPALTAVEAAARAAVTADPFDLDSLLFGKWRD